MKSKAHMKKCLELGVSHPQPWTIQRMLVRIFCTTFSCRWRMLEALISFSSLTACVDDTQKSLGSMPVETTVKQSVLRCRRFRWRRWGWTRWWRRWWMWWWFYTKNIVQKHKSSVLCQSTSHVCLAVSLNTLTQAASTEGTAWSFFSEYWWWSDLWAVKQFLWALPTSAAFALLGFTSPEVHVSERRSLTTTSPVVKPWFISFKGCFSKEGSEHQRGFFTYPAAVTCKAYRFGPIRATSTVSAGSTKRGAQGHVPMEGVLSAQDPHGSGKECEISSFLPFDQSSECKQTLEWYALRFTFMHVFIQCNILYIAFKAHNQFLLSLEVNLLPWYY